MKIFLKYSLSLCYSPTDQPVCKCLIIMLSIHAVTVVTNHSSAYNTHLVGTSHRSMNHRPHRPSQNAIAQSGPGKPDKLSQNP